MIRLLTDTFTVVDLIACDRCGITAAEYFEYDTQPRFWDIGDARGYLAGWIVNAYLVLCYGCRPEDPPPGTEPDLTEAITCLAEEDTALVSFLCKAFTGAASPTDALDALDAGSPTSAPDPLFPCGTVLTDRLEYHVLTITQALRALAHAEGDAA